MPDRIPMYALLEDAGKVLSVVKHIEAGDVFVYPTDTIYGIGGRADSNAVNKRIIAAKSRPPSNPMILLAGRKDVFTAFGVKFSKLADVLADHFWPGNLTLVLPYMDEKQTVGVRVSGHPFINVIYESLDVPVFSTSANISGEPYINDPDAIYSVFQDKIDFMVDAGVLPPSPPSTIVRIVSDLKIEIVRVGVIPEEKIMSVVVNNINK
jgi:L-threonylcarbamoyladenylate synthase